MTRQRTTLLDRGPAPALGAFLAGRPEAAAARRDAEPEPVREPHGRLQRLVALARRRPAEASPARG